MKNLGTLFGVLSISALALDHSNLEPLHEEGDFKVLVDPTIPTIDGPKP